MMMYCTKCGKKLNEGAVFCSYCGEKQPSSVTPESEMSSVVKKNGKGWKAVLTVVCLVTVCGFGVNLFSGVHKQIPQDLKNQDIAEIPEDTTQPETEAISTKSASEEYREKTTTAKPAETTAPRTTAKPVTTTKKVTTAKKVTTSPKTTTAKKVTTAPKSTYTITTIAKPVETVPQTTIDVNKVQKDLEDDFEDAKAYSDWLKGLSDEELKEQGMTPEERDGLLKLYGFSSLLYQFKNLLPQKTNKTLEEIAQEETIYIDGDDAITLNEDILGVAYRTIIWTDRDGEMHVHDVEFPVDDYLYYVNSYHDLGMDRRKYADDEYNRSLMKQCAENIQKVCKEKGLNKTQTMYEAIHYVQAFPYQLDIDSHGVNEYPNYPIETLYLNCGDCEDTAILLSGILREMGYQTALFLIPPVGDVGGHMAMGINTKSLDDFVGETISFDNGEKYFYVESTAYGFYVGQIPSMYFDEAGNMIASITAYPLGK
ncbi:MAG TPA: hypothetical protein DCO72_01800 [Ruminococcus sp.]|nr:hypothetical protein [Ruminococcus sp.]